MIHASASAKPKVVPSEDAIREVHPRQDRIETLPAENVQGEKERKSPSGADLPILAE
jgi:tetrahydromethanopterin S-methyltransferase subunit G